MLSHKISIIIPCFNEENRLDIYNFNLFNKSQDEISFYFINDGSTDGTLKIIEGLASCNSNVFFVNLKENVGKAEAVRLGVLEAYRNEESEWFGFWDADFATPLRDLDLFKNCIQDKLKFITGARVRRLGTNIKREPFRHYFGRVFATIISLLFKLNTYDTQCGSKIFRKELIPIMFNRTFSSKWFFDVELFLRLKDEFGSEWLPAHCYELPLTTWVDPGGSKIKLMDFVKAPANILSLYFKYK